MLGLGLARGTGPRHTLGPALGAGGMHAQMHRGRRHTAYLGTAVRRGGGVGGNVCGDVGGKVRRGGRVFRGDHIVRCGGGRVRRVVLTGVRRGGAVTWAIVVLSGVVNSPCSLHQETTEVENMSKQTVENATTTKKIAVGQEVLANFHSPFGSGAITTD